MNIKKIIISLAFVLTLFSVSAYAKTMQFTMGDVNSKVDGGTIEVHTMEVAPYTIDGRTMVPARIVAETFEADVKWIEEESKVIITLNDDVITLIIGDINADVNGEKIKLDVAPVKTNDRTLVPLRFVSETLGFDVEYIPSTEQILITDDPAPVAVNGYDISLAAFDAMFDLYYMQYGEAYGAEGVAGAVQLALMDYAIYGAEAAKWDIDISPEAYADIKASAQELAVLLPDNLDGVWAYLVEMELKAYNLNEFLGALYMPEAEEAEEYYYDNYMSAKHILILAETQGAKTVAKDIKAQLNKGADFDELMLEYSQDTGLQTNPDGYVFTTGDMIEEFETAVKGLKSGKVSGVVESPYGYHIIKRTDLPEFNQSIYEEVAVSMALQEVADHYAKIAESAQVSTDAYTTEELIAICK